MDFVVENLFFRKNTWTDVVFAAAFEYAIYFLFKLGYLVGWGCEGEDEGEGEDESVTKLQ